MTTMQGMDVQALRAFANEVGSSGRRLSQMAADVELALARAPWGGQDAADFRGLWSDRLRPSLAGVAERLEQARSQLLVEATEQEDASESGGASTLGAQGSARLVTPAVALVTFPDWFNSTWASPWGLAGWALTGVSFAVDATVRAAQTNKGRFAPRGPDGRFVPFKDGQMSRWQQTLRVLRSELPLQPGWRESAFKPTAGRAASYSTWAKVGKWGGRAGVLLTGLLSGAEQWNRDAGMDTGARVGRAAVAGGINAATGWAGAAAGAKVGAVVGTFIGGPGVGTVMGALIGGLAGGLLGGYVGSAVTDAALGNS